LPRACIDGPAPSGAGNAVSGTYRVSIVWRGLTSLPSAAAVNACGFGAGITDYDDPETGDADVYRRILAIETYIDVLSAASAAPAPGT
jgi:hypothetical protein